MFLPIQPSSRLNFQSDFAEDDPERLSFILNKPDVITQAEREKLESIEAGAQVNLPFGDEVDTVTEGNDFRLSNDREWLAPTVTFEEAIAGTDDFRKAWTAARVRAAIESIAVPKTGGTFSGSVKIEGVLTTDFLQFRSQLQNTPVGTNVLVQNSGGSNNTALGYEALRRNSNGDSNTAVGHSALFNNNGEKNTASGFNSLYSNTSGKFNTAHGVESLYKSTGALGNTAVGHQAAYNSEGNFNTVVGEKALFNNSNGSNNTALGRNAGGSNNGFNNVFIGAEAGFNETGSNKLHIGNNNSNTSLIFGDFFSKELQVNGDLTVTNDFEVLGTSELSQVLAENLEVSNVAKVASLTFTNTSNNVVIGENALSSNTTGVDNTTVGRLALNQNTKGIFNVSVGGRSLSSNITGNNNTALGYKAGFSSLGFGNIFIGSAAGFNNTGDHNVFLGRLAGFNETGSNKLYISNTETNNPLIFGDFFSKDLQINGDLTVTNDFEVVGTSELSQVIAENLEVSNVAKVASLTFTNTSNNVVIGENALSSNTTGINNTALGNFALTSNESGSFNSAFGQGALFSNTIGILNSAFGLSALFSNTSGEFNTASGVEALFSNTEGIRNSAFGVRSLKNNTTGSFNSAFGLNALFSNTSGGSNTASGVEALFSSTEGRSNSAFGVRSLKNNTTGSFNSAFGLDTLTFNTTGSFNLAGGVDSLKNNQIGNNNVSLGYQAGFNSIGSGNVFIGKKAGFNETGSNKLYISNSDTNSPLIYGDFSISQLQINGDLTVTNDFEVVGTIESNNIEVSSNATISGLLRSSRLNSLDIALNNTVKKISPLANRGIFAIAFTGTSSNSSNVTHQMESSGLIAYDVGSIKFLSVLTSNSNGLVVVGENDPAGELQPNKIVVGVANGVLKFRSTWDENTLTSITFIA